MKRDVDVVVTVSFDGGSIIGKFPFWMPDEKIIEDVISRLPFPRDHFRNLKVEREFNS